MPTGVSIEFLLGEVGEKLVCVLNRSGSGIDQYINRVHGVS